MSSAAQWGANRDHVATIGVLTHASCLIEAQRHASKLHGMELRGDLLPSVNLEWARSQFEHPILYTLRSKPYEGSFEGSSRERLRLLRSAPRHFDFVDLEAGQDLSPEILSAVPPHQRVITWHGPATDCSGLNKIFDGLLEYPAAFYRLLPWTERPGDEIEPLLFLLTRSRRDVVAYSRGRNGFWTRIVAPYLGYPAVFASLEASAREQGELTLHRLDDYQLSRLSRLPDEVYGIVANPAFHSLSPRLHNAAHTALGRSALYLPFEVADFSSFWRRLVEEHGFAQVGLSLKGLTVASPHKEAAAALAHSTRLRSARAESANILFRDDEHWVADTTDPEGILLCLAKRDWMISGKRVAVVGCGGAGRAIAESLSDAGADVTLVNRGLARGERAVQLLGLRFVPLSQFRCEGYSLVINATPVGRDGGAAPFTLEDLGGDAVVADLVYGAQQTALMARARDRGMDVIDGKEVLLTEVRKQFQLMTGMAMPMAVAQNVLGIEADASSALAANTYL